MVIYVIFSAQKNSPPAPLHEIYHDIPQCGVFIFFGGVGGLVLGGGIRNIVQEYLEPFPRPLGGSSKKIPFEDS